MSITSYCDLPNRRRPYESDSEEKATVSALVEFYSALLV